MIVVEPELAVVVVPVELVEPVVELPPSPLQVPVELQEGVELDEPVVEPVVELPPSPLHVPVRLQEGTELDEPVVEPVLELPPSPLQVPVELQEGTELDDDEEDPEFEEEEPEVEPEEDGAPVEVPNEEPVLDSSRAAVSGEKLSFEQFWKQSTRRLRLKSVANLYGLY